MAKRSERTLQMIENFMSLHNAGYSISEIADVFGLSSTTVYKYVPEIAKKAGVTREDLLERNFVADHSGRNFTPVKPIDRKKFDESFELMMDGVNSINSEITRTIKDIETMNDLLEGEMKI